MLQDRELVRAERIAEQSRHEQLFEALTSRLQKAQARVCDLTTAVVQSKRNQQGNEENWASERNQLIRNLDLCRVSIESDAQELHSNIIYY